MMYKSHVNSNADAVPPGGSLLFPCKSWTLPTAADSPGDAPSSALGRTEVSSSLGDLLISFYF